MVSFFFLQADINNKEAMPAKNKIFNVLNFMFNFLLRFKINCLYGYNMLFYPYTVLRLFFTIFYQDIKISGSRGFSCCFVIFIHIKLCYSLGICKNRIYIINRRWIRLGIANY